MPEALKVNAPKRRVLEIGYGGRPIISHYLDREFRNKRLSYGSLYRSPRDLMEVLPRDVEYHGIDFYRDSGIEYIISQILAGEGTEDIIKERLLTAEREYNLLKPSNIFLYHMSATDLGFRNKTFDEVHAHFFVTDPDIKISELECAAKEVRRVLKNGGSLIISGELQPSLGMPEPKGMGYWFIRQSGLILDNGREALDGATALSDIIRQAAQRQYPGLNRIFLFVARKD